MQTREQWLTQATDRLRPLLTTVEVVLPPKLLLSVGFPKSGGGAKTTIGQCWGQQASADGSTQHIFVCPTLSRPTLVVSVLLHELVHAGVGVDAKHRGPFARAMRALGFTGRLTATDDNDVTETLKAQLDAVVADLSEYPHSAIVPKERPQREGRLNIVLRSTNDDDYKIGMKTDLFKEHGAPLDPWGEKMVPVRE